MPATLAGTNLVANLPEPEVDASVLAAADPQAQQPPIQPEQPPAQSAQVTDQPPEDTQADEIAAFKAMFGELGNEQPQSPQDQKSSSGPEDYRQGDLSFSEAEFDAAMKDHAGFNKAMQTAYVKTVTDAVQHAVSYMNQVMEQRMKVQEIVNEFYSQYNDLRPYKHIVKAAMEEVARVHPGADLPTRLVKAAAAARQYVGNKRAITPNGVLKTNNSRPPTQPAPKSRADELMGAFLKKHIGG